MSSIVIGFDDDHAYVATDTLVVRDGKPVSLATKAFCLPHLQMIVASTGAAMFLDHWLSSLNQAVLRGIDDLEKHAQGGLAALWVEYLNQFPAAQNVSTTVYHVGLSEITGKMRGSYFSAGYGFESKPLPKLCFKPDHDLAGAWQIPRDIPKIMNNQRAKQRRKSPKNRVYIGGEIHLIHLHKGNFAIERLAKFRDFDKTRAAILAERQ